MTSVWRFTCVFMLVVFYAFPVGAWEPGKAVQFGKSKAQTVTSKLALGVMWMPEIPGFTGYPFEEGDLSYKLFYEYHEGIGFWQLGLGYTPSPGNDAIDDVLTPEINLILEDGVCQLGLGAMMSHVNGEVESDWTDVYWQIIAGIEIPLGSRFGLELHGHYLFEQWGDIGDSDKGGPGGSVLLSFSF